MHLLYDSSKYINSHIGESEYMIIKEGLKIHYKILI